MIGDMKQPVVNYLFNLVQIKVLIFIHSLSKKSPCRFLHQIEWQPVKSLVDKIRINKQLQLISLEFKTAIVSDFIKLKCQVSSSNPTVYIFNQSGILGWDGWHVCTMHNLDIICLALSQNTYGSY